MVSPTSYIGKELKEGRLVTIMDDYTVAPELNIHAVYLERRYLSPKVSEVRFSGGASHLNYAVTPLLNPYEDDPAAQFLALGYMVARRPGRDRARLSIEHLGLNRQALLERRKERIELLQALADQFSLAQEGPTKDLIRTELTRQARDDGEYAFVVRAYLEAACGLRFNAAAGSDNDALTAAATV